MKIIIFAESSSFVDKIIRFLSDYDITLTIAQEWQGCLALLGAQEFDVLITNLRPIGYGSTVDISVLRYVKANYPAITSFAILDAENYNGDELEIKLVEQQALSNGAATVLDPLKDNLQLQRYITHHLDFKLARGRKIHINRLGDVEKFISNGSLTAHFQPIYDLKNPSKMVACEALARGTDNSLLGIPGILFSYAGYKQLFAEVDFACIIRALKNAILMPANMDLYLNVQPRSLTNIDFPDRLLQQLAQVNRQPGTVVLELTEQKEILNQQCFALSINRLREMGFRLAIDDFGEGNSNLELIIKVLPSIIKISGVICKHVVQDQKVQEVIRGIATMNRSTGGKTIAEYIESKQQADLLLDLGVDYGQGFYFSKAKKITDLQFSNSERPCLLRDTKYY